MFRGRTTGPPFPVGKVSGYTKTTFFSITKTPRKRFSLFLKQVWENSGTPYVLRTCGKNKCEAWSILAVVKWLYWVDSYTERNRKAWRVIRGVAAQWRSEHYFLCYFCASISVSESWARGFGAAGWAKRARERVSRPRPSTFYTNRYHQTVHFPQ